MIVDAERDTFFSANSVGARIWEELAQPVTIDEISSTIAKDIEGAADAPIKEDVTEFLKSLEENGLVQQVKS